MSGVEVIGLVLGVLPLIISAAEDYKRGFEPFLKWHRYKREFRSFINSIDLERQMLNGLLGQLLKYTDLPFDEKQLLLSGTDHEAWQREDTVKALKLRLGDSYLSCIFILETMKEDMITLQNMMSLKNGSVDWAKPGEDKWNYQRKRIAHSFSKKGPETVASLENNNRKFRELLDLLDRRLVDTKLSHGKFNKKDTTWARLFGSVRLRAKALHATLSRAWICNCVHLTNLRLQERHYNDSSSFALTFATSELTRSSNFMRSFLVTVIESPDFTASRPKAAPIQGSYLDDIRANLDSKPLSEVKTVSFASSRGSSVIPRFTSSTYPTKSDSLVTLSSNQRIGTRIMIKEGHDRTPAKADSPKIKKSVRMNVPVEHSNANPVHKPQSSLDLDLETTQVQTTKDSEIKIDNLCSALKAVKPDSISIGYLSDDCDRQYRFQSIADHSLSAHNDELLSLNEMLSNPSQGKLTRKQRFKLAQVLASSMLQLQTTPWLTIPLKKENIFFPRQGLIILADQPYIRHSFPSETTSEASSNQVANQSENRFATQKAAQKSLMHLGILLLELCFGQTIETQNIRSQYLLDGKAYNGTDELTARDWIYYVGEEAGEDFEKAVKSCVLCNFDAKLNWEDANFTQSVYVGVVQPLEKTIADLGWAADS